MHRIKRLGLVCVGVVAAAMIPIAIVVAAGGGLAPGDYKFTTVSASAEFGLGKGSQTSVFLFVSRGLNSYQPEHPKGPAIVTKSTEVTLSIFTQTSSLSGCWIIPDSDFSASTNLQSASLDTTLTDANMCPGPATPVSGSTSGPAPFAGGGGGGGITLPITLEVTWDGLGVTSTQHDRGTFQCLSFSTSSSDFLRSSNANAQMEISALDDPMTADFANVSSDNQHIDVNGTLPSACQ